MMPMSLCCRELAQYEQGLNDDVFREAHSGREVLNYQVSGWVETCWQQRGSLRCASPVAQASISCQHSTARCATSRCCYLLEQMKGVGCSPSLLVSLQALRYSRAAAAVRACAYELRPNVEAGDLPFVGAVTGGNSEGRGAPFEPGLS